MECMDIVNVVAILISPIFAVAIGQLLQNNAEKRKDKINIFKTLMTGRILGWDLNSVHALNLIDIVFSDDDKVRRQWKEFCKATKGTDLKDMEIQQCKLLETIAKSLGYKDKITWEEITSPYLPQGVANKIQIEQKIQKGQTQVADFMDKLNSLNLNIPPKKDEDVNK